MTDSTAAIQAALTGVIPDARHLGIRRMAGGVSARVYRITRDGKRFYLRVLPEEGATFAPEVRAHQLVREAGARVPEVLHHEARSEALGRSIMLTTEIQGAPLDRHTPERIARRAAIEAGRDLATNDGSHSGVCRSPSGRWLAVSSERRTARS